MAGSRIGTGVTFSKGGLSGENVTNISITGASRPALSTANLASTVTNPFIGGALMDWGSITMDFNVDVETDGDTILTEAKVVGGTNLVIAFHDAATTTFTVSAFCTDYDAFTVPLEDVMTCSITWKCAGLPSWSP